MTIPITRDRQYFSALGIQIYIDIFWSLNTKCRKDNYLHDKCFFKKHFDDFFSQRRVGFNEISASENLSFQKVSS